jgi:hypothetical protein
VILSLLLGDSLAIWSGLASPWRTARLSSYALVDSGVAAEIDTQFYFLCSVVNGHVAR